MNATARVSMLLIALTACGGGAKETNTTPASSEAAAVEAAPAAAATAASKGSRMGKGAQAARARSTFAMIPKGVQLVGGVSVAQLRRSAAWPALRKAAEDRTGSEVRDTIQLCKMDPFEVVDTVEFGIANVGAGGEDLAIVVNGSFTRAGIAQCAKAIAAKENETMMVTDEGSATSYATGKEAVWTGWPADGTVVFGGAERDVAWINDRIAGKDSVRGDDAFMEAVGNADTGATAWMVFVDDANGQLQMLAGFFGGRTPTSVFASLQIAEGARAEIGFVFETPDDADVAIEAINKAIEPLKNDPAMGKYIAASRVSRFGANAVVELDLNKQQFEELIQGVLTQGF